MTVALAILRKVPLWLWLALAAAGAIAWLNWRLDAVTTERDAKAGEITTLQNRNASLKQTARLQRELAEDFSRASTTYQEGLANAQTDIDRLRHDLDSKPERLLVHGTCVPRAASTDHAATSGPDGATCQLTADARSGYLDLRRGLAAKDAQIVGLQALARSLQAKCFVREMTK